MTETMMPIIQLNGIAIAANCCQLEIPVVLGGIPLYGILTHTTQLNMYFKMIFTEILPCRCIRKMYKGT